MDGAPSRRWSQHPEVRLHKCEMPWERSNLLGETRRLREDVCACGRSRSFDEFSERKFPESRRKAYYLIAIHEQLPRIHKVKPQQVGWSKATKLAKVARRDGQRFDCATWLHKARELPKEEFKREVSKHLTGKGSEPREILYFKAYKSQLPVIEQALETVGLMLGTDKSRGYCLEMICADFLAGVSWRRATEMLYCLVSLGWSLVFRNCRGNNSLKKCRSRFERDPRQATLLAA
jgi:hypothetical protein